MFPAKTQQTKCKRPIESKQSDNVRKAAKRACETGEEQVHTVVLCVGPFLCRFSIDRDGVFTC